MLPRGMVNGWRVAVAGSEKKMKAFVVYPERKDKAPVVIVIQEIFGPYGLDQVRCGSTCG